jgi:porphobilinogen deaminase
MGRKGTLYLIYSLYQQAALQNFNFSRNFLILLKVQRCNVSCAKQARVLSRNEIQKIVMVSDSDEDKHYASKESKDKNEPHPHSRRCSIPRHPSPNYSASSRRIWP